ncbi:MAG: aldehyde dehydrogenase family protein [Bacteroidetes bacterium]|nr:MAG: aldehyde dehydrogenase family protein [Bacteroidota bacterium]
MPQTSTDLTHIPALVARQKQWIAQGHSRDVDVRRQQIRRLLSAVEAAEGDLLEAMQQDLAKPATEAWLTDIGTVLEEGEHVLKNLRQWMRPRKAATPWMHSPSSAYQLPEPYGVVAVIGPWNYPVSMLLVPTIGALAAGNAVIIKPSEFVPYTNAVLGRLITDTFPVEEVAWLPGAIPETTALLSEPLDYIFFTGSPAVGRIVMQAAARHLTPVTLELGGKSPVILDEHVDLEVATRRIVWGKCLNAGQTCVAPDYLLVHRKVKAEALAWMQRHLRDFFGPDPQQSPDFGRIIHDRHVARLAGLIEGQIVTGGQVDVADRYVAPTLIEVDNPETHPAMQEEIFGPILPIIPYDRLEEAIRFINARPKPLALYVFTTRSRVRQAVIERTSSGSVCVNDLVVQVGLSDLPFGGVGESGMGSYHGQRSFDTFSHLKSVMRRNFLADAPGRFAPYRVPLALLKPLIRWLG